MTTIRELTERYVFEKDLRESSAKTYRATCNAYIRRFGNVDAQTYKRDDIIRWRDDFIGMGREKRSWNTYSSHLRTLFKFGIENELLSLTKNPFNETRLVPPRKKKKTVVHHAIRAARDWLETMESDERRLDQRAKITPAWFWIGVYDMFYHTGIRLNALISMRLQDVNLEEQKFLIRGETEKTHRDFELPITDALRPTLVRIVEAARDCGFKPSDQLFNVNRFSTYYERETMDANQVSSMYKKLTAMVGVRLSPHRFRHTLASDLMKRPDRDIHTAMHLMNHSNIATTMEYIEHDLESMRTAMESRALSTYRPSRLARIEQLSPNDGSPKKISGPGKSLGLPAPEPVREQDSGSSSGMAHSDIHLPNIDLDILSEVDIESSEKSRVERWQSLIRAVGEKLSSDIALQLLMQMGGDNPEGSSTGNTYRTRAVITSKPEFRRRR